MLSKVATFQYFFAKIFAKGYVVSDKCNLCQWCIENCPTNNISLKYNKIKFE
jgi:ferredoxin